MNYIDRVGLEVEGGWDGEPFVPPFDDLDLIDDHSIDGTTQPTDKRLECPHIGEAVSKPIDLREIDDWIEKYWPPHTNITCGYHIHVSVLEPMYYMFLTKKTFAFTLLREMRKLGQELKLPETHYLWYRLSGENPFCALSFDASSQMEVKAKRVGMRVRYGFLNFAQKIHNTMEFRALPTFPSKAHAKLFTWRYLDVINEFLEKELARNHKKSISLLDEDGFIHTVRRTE